MKKYIVLDTNIIVSFFEGGFSLAQQKGTLTSPEDSIILNRLLKALKDNKVELIMPEVVILECERIKEEKKSDLNKLYFSAIKKVEEDPTVLNKRISLKSFKKIEKTMEKIRDQEKNEIEKSSKIFKNICKHRNTHIIQLNENTLLKAYKRGLKGKKPFTQRHTENKNPIFNNKPIHDIQPDCIIIESVKDFLSTKKDFELYFGTNDGSFFTTIEKQAIHPDIQTELKITGFSLTLSNLLNQALGLKVQKKKKNISEQSLHAFPLVPKDAIDEGKGEKNLNLTKG